MPQGLNFGPISNGKISWNSKKNTQSDVFCFACLLSGPRCSMKNMTIFPGTCSLHSYSKLEPFKESPYLLL